MSGRVVSARYGPEFFLGAAFAIVLFVASLPTVPVTVIVGAIVGAILLIATSWAPSIQRLIFWGIVIFFIGVGLYGVLTRYGVPAGDERIAKRTLPKTLSSPVRENIATAPRPPIRNPLVDRPATQTPVQIPPTDIARVPSATRLANIIDYEMAPVSDASIDFPLDHFRASIGDSLGTFETNIKSLRVGAAFIEPGELRSQASQGAVIGYLYVTLPDVVGCSRQFGGVEEYEYASPTIGIAYAINANSGAIANWLKRATEGEIPKCPG